MGSRRRLALLRKGRASLSARGGKKSNKKGETPWLRSLEPRRRLLLTQRRKKRGTMSSGFFGRVFGYVFNELLVNGLANSRTFQQFAVRTDKVLREVQQSGEWRENKKKCNFWFSCSCRTVGSGCILFILCFHVHANLGAGGTARWEHAVFSLCSPLPPSFRSPKTHTLRHTIKYLPHPCGEISRSTES